MHVFLTGERRSGKSWAVKEIVRQLNMPLQGFISDFLPGEHGMQLFMMPAAQPGLMDEAHLVAHRVGDRMQAIPDRFEAVGVPLLEEAMRHPEALILMDECGHLEKQSEAFQQAIQRCLDGRTPVLGVLRKGQAWHDAIRQHPHVCVLELTEENREAIVPQAIALLNQELPKGRMLKEALVPWTLNGAEQSALLCSPQEVDALITGLLYTSGAVNDPSQLRVTEQDGVWHVATALPVQRKPLENRIPELTVCTSPLRMAYDRIVALSDQLMAIDNSNGQHTVMLTIGGMQIICRDIGRHNALDKAIGTALLRQLPLSEAVMCTSGRVNIEILAKIAAAGIPIACSRKQVGDMAERVASQLNIAVVQPGKQPCIYGAKHRVIDFHQEGGVR